MQSAMVRNGQRIDLWMTTEMVYAVIFLRFSCIFSHSPSPSPRTDVSLDIFIEKSLKQLLIPALIYEYEQDDIMLWIMEGILK